MLRPATYLRHRVWSTWQHTCCLYLSITIPYLWVIVDGRCSFLDGADRKEGQDMGRNIAFSLSLSLSLPASNCEVIASASVILMIHQARLSRQHFRGQSLHLQLPWLEQQSCTSGTCPPSHPLPTYEQVPVTAHHPRYLHLSLLCNRGTGLRWKQPTGLTWTRAI